jgi:tetratricopeptide (TPR) repeat protein
MNRSVPLTFFLLIVATTLESSGDGVVRLGLRQASFPLRVALFLAGATLLFGYGVLVNLPAVEFGRIVGLYVATLFVVWQIINFTFFGTLPTIPVVAGGTLIVIARNSSFTYKGKPVDTKQAARELGVRYVLESSVRKSGNRVRVTGQLIEAETGHHLWADRFDGDLVDIFDLQDQLVTRVVGAIAPQLEKAEIERAKRELTSNPAAYDFYLRGLASWNRWSKAENAKALKLFDAAIDKDPDFATPYGLAASCYQFAKANGWQSEFDAMEISRLTERAVEVGNDDAVALCWAGHVRAFFFKEVDRALLLIDRALELDVNLAVAWQRSGWVRGYAGDSAGAIESLNKAMRLDPLDTLVFLTQSAMAFAHFIAGRDQEAAKWAAMALRTKPNWMPALRVAIASNAMKGRAGEAKAALQSYERVDPTVSIRKICEHYPFRRQKDKQRLVTALRKAGVPEA